MESEALTASEAESAAVATAPRVTLESMQAKIVREEYVVVNLILTLCILTMQNGFFVVGESAPASPENFDAELGKKFAYENAIRQLWKLEGYSLRDRLAAQEKD
ncbi:MAG: hypothetical protein RJA99_1420 [Pseudomonadota bacterium]|jgi:hypothetical protein